MFGQFFHQKITSGNRLADKGPLYKMMLDEVYFVPIVEECCFLFHSGLDKELTPGQFIAKTRAVFLQAREEALGVLELSDRISVISVLFGVKLVEVTSFIKSKTDTLYIAMAKGSP